MDGNAGGTPTRSIEIDGQQLRVAVRPGDGERWPLLLINGLGANLELLQPFVDRLDHGIEVVRVDLPGAGGSPAPVFPYRPAGLATLLTRLLDLLAYAEVDVLGISLGGAIAQEFAHRFPRRCRRLVLVSTSTGAVMIPGNPFVLIKMLTPHRYADPVHMAEIAPTLYGGRLRANPGLIAAHSRTVRLGGPLGYYWQLLGVAGWTSVFWLHRLQQPTLILSGTDDPIVPAINATILARLIPNARLHLFDDGHLGLLTSADTLAPLVDDFLSVAVTHRPAPA
jgi:poly(3-hydroxyalkanoate) depolymerase